MRCVVCGAELAGQQSKYCSDACRSRAYYERHRDEMKAKMRVYYLEHADERREYKRRYYSEHRDAVLLKDKMYRVRQAACHG